MYEYQATVLRVVDGDTLHAEVDLGLDIHVQLTLRLAEINAPEHWTKEGQVATVWLERMLPPGQLVTVRTIKDHREKYGRYLAYLYIDTMRPATNEPPLMHSLNQALVDAGQAVRYEGGKR